MGKRATIFWSILLSSFSLQAASLQFCSDQGSPSTFKSQISVFLLSSEQVIPLDVRCVLIQTASFQRDEFMREIVRRQMPAWHEFAFMQATRQLRECQIEVETVEQRNGDQRDIEISSDRLKIKDTQENLGAKSTFFLRLENGAGGSFRWGDYSFWVICQKSSTDNIALEISYQSLESGVSTRLEFSKGEKREIGSYLQDLADKGRTISLGGFKHSQEKGKKSGKIWVKVL